MTFLSRPASLALTVLGSGLLLVAMLAASCATWEASAVGEASVLSARVDADDGARLVVSYSIENKGLLPITSSTLNLGFESGAGSYARTVCDESRVPAGQKVYGAASFEFISLDEVYVEGSARVLSAFFE